ncbi:MAG: ABC transporter permease subunit [Xylanivirga thermophila]|jgi:raffinose/stachyose/melibiose transport system permease protein|uniref:carbohydrate ABC transporter permease n=1 Tax=Xylanivirga thermophila TaxID=2496273 RepID=UPI0039F5FB91
MSTKVKKKGSGGKTITYIVLCLYAFTTIYPLVWVINNSFKPSKDVIQHSFALPNSFYLDNYVNAFKKMSIGRGYLNSFIVSGSVVVLVILFGGMAAYVMSRYNFKTKGFFNMLIVGSLLFPAYVTAIPLFGMLYKMKLTNTYLGLILPQVAGNLSFAIIVLMGYLVTIPIELEEAAVVEGCNAWQIYSKVIFPIAKPAFATVGIFSFLWSYNDLFMSIIILRSRNMQPINVLLNEISSQYGTDYGLMASAITIIVLPMLCVYLAFQQQIVDGLTAGAVKG